MEYKNSVEAVYIQLNDILQHVAEWGSEETLRTIDIDLTLNKLRDVYDIIHSLKTEQLTQAIPSNETPTQYLEETIVEENIEEKVEEVEDSESSSIEFEVEEITWLPQDSKDISEDDMPMFEKFMEMLNDCDDVQEVYHNAVMPG